MSDIVQYEKQGRIAVITLNRAEARNAINGDVARGMEDCMRWKAGINQESEPSIQPIRQRAYKTFGL